MYSKLINNMVSSFRYAYSAEEKLSIIDYALAHTQAKAAYHHGIHKSMVCRWVKQLGKIKSANPYTKRIGSGRKPYKVVDFANGSQLHNVNTVHNS
ncbi:hypothetical protein BC833DRAFT_593191 [Globomyces pollinis-pini]|nr:hypothetical protein BC833DRAFT_593191 [Globomyces pollinis-pini]